MVPFKLLRTQIHTPVPTMGTWFRKLHKEIQHRLLSGKKKKKGSESPLISYVKVCVHTSVHRDVRKNNHQTWVVAFSGGGSAWLPLRCELAETCTDVSHWKCPVARVFPVDTGPCCS